MLGTAEIGGRRMGVGRDCFMLVLSLKTFKFSFGVKNHHNDDCQCFVLSQNALQIVANVSSIIHNLLFYQQI